MTRFVSTTNCFVRKDDAILMLRRSDTIYKFPGFWMGPGGRQEPTEDILSACIREVAEETGLTIENVSLRVIATHHYPHKDEVYLVFIFVADYVDGQPQGEEELGTLEWLKEEDALALDRLYPDLKVHLPLALDHSSELYFTHMEFDHASNIVKERVSPISTYRLGQYGN